MLKLYQTSKGYILNADVNGALNILRKSNVVDLEVLYSRGEVDTPVRIRIAYLSNFFRITLMSNYEAPISLGGE